MGKSITVETKAGRTHGESTGMTQNVGVTTGAEYYDEQAEGTELWSPRNAIFNGPDWVARAEAHMLDSTLETILDQSTGDST